MNNMLNFKNLKEFNKQFPDEQSCRNFFEQIRWNGKIICPHCKSDKTSKFTNGKLYWCKNCSKQFTVKLGTIFGDSALPLKTWFLAIYLLTSRKKGISSVQLSKDIGVTQKTAWFMLHRIRFAVRTRSFEKVSGIVEADETFVGGKERNKHFNKRLKDITGGVGKQIVAGVKERNGNVRAHTVENTTRHDLNGFIIDNVKAGSTLYTDEHSGYDGLTEFDREKVRHSIGEYVRGRVHTNGIESFWALFKRGYHGTYHWMSKKHLDKYVDEFEFRLNSKDITDPMRLGLTLNHCEGRLTYTQLITQKS